jgi:hypothetical protein
MPSLIGSGIDANYRRPEVPYSHFGTRKVIWFSIGRVDTRTSDFTLDNLEMNKLIDCIQTRAEIAIIGAPKLGENYGRFTVGIFEDTFNNGNDTIGIDGSSSAGYNANASTLQTILEAATDGDVDVSQVYIFGGHHGDAEYDNGWNYDSDYQEYNSKAEYVANSYLNPNDQ